LTRRISPIALCVVVSLSISTAVALADPAGKDTRQETITYEGGSPFADLNSGPGQKTKVRKELAKPQKGRAKRRKSLAFFGQLTDPQIVDEMSPGHVELADPIASPFESAWRPQEAWGLQNFDQLVRNMNDNRKSAFAQRKGKHAKFKFVLDTGDMADDSQLNEVRWYIQVLEGGQVDPFSGVLATPQNCSNASDAERAQLNAAVAARRYTGPQDYSDWPGEPADRYDAFWDPDQAPPDASSPYAAWPRYPGLLDRAQQMFTAEGLDVPWYTARGNHDTIWQGTFLAPGAIKLLITSCFKIFPNDKFDPTRYQGHPELIVQDLNDPAFQAAQVQEARFVPPDPDRRFLQRNEFKRLHGSADNGHGFKFVADKQNKQSNGAAEYYAFTKNGIRFIAIDTNADGGDASGNVDDPQYNWIQKQLKKAKKKGLLVIAYGHHPLQSETSKVKDEAAPACEEPTDTQCDADPRKSTPLHRGLKGKKSMRDLFLEFPNFIAFVVGHRHENEIKPFEKKNGKSGFWEIQTASEIDWPQQGRLVEVMNNADGTLSIFATVVDTAAPIEAPAPGQATVFTDTQLGSLSRKIAANDPQSGVTGSVNSHAEGKPKDRNVELLLKDPLD
jgi:metallophosphoesterase (TIGR03767 family)